MIINWNSVGSQGKKSLKTETSIWIEWNIIIGWKWINFQIFVLKQSAKKNLANKKWAKYSLMDENAHQMKRWILMIKNVDPSFREPLISSVCFNVV